MFPSPEKLLGDFLRFEPYTHNGQWEAARRVIEIVEQYNLGTAKIFEYPEFPDGTGETYPLVKVIAEHGLSSPNEMMTWLGHLDVVNPVGDQVDRDALVIEQNPKDPTRTLGRGRGSLDMWGGNVAYLCALELLRQSGRARSAIQLILSSQEEAGSGILYQALRNEDLEPSFVGATTEILVGDDGRNSPLYIGRTGRIGINAIFMGNMLHTGEVDRHPAQINEIAHRFYARAMDELLDDERKFRVENRYPSDSHNLLPAECHAIPGFLVGKPEGLSVPGSISQHFDFHHTDPNLSPELLRTKLHEYLVERANIPDYRIELSLEHRHGVPFIEPWLTPFDHPLVDIAHGYAQEIQGGDVEIVAASGVAEDGMLFHRLKTNMVGWAPIGKGAHTEDEHVRIESIMQRAVWLQKLAEYSGILRQTS